MKKIVLLILISVLISCTSNQTKEPVSIILKTIIIECNAHETEEGVFFQAGEMYLDFLVENTGDEAINFSTYNSKYSDSGPKYGIFSVHLNDTIFNLNSNYPNSQKFLPNESMKYICDYEGDFVSNFGISTCEVKNNERLLDILNNWEILFTSLYEGFEESSYPQHEIKVNVDSFVLGYGSWDEKYSLLILYDKNGINGTNDYLIDIDSLDEEEKLKLIENGYEI
ncbi:MAG: hypothetical protein LUF87_01870 [Alistipes sp.]|nr:hypothetical protein [Alistipes sp.]